MKQFYVSVSRGRERVHLYTDDKEELLEHAARSGNRVGAMELVGQTITRRQDRTRLSPPSSQKPQIPTKPYAPVLMP